MADAILPASGIYAITNAVNGKKYIGSAVRLRRRFAEHVRLLTQNRHHSQTLQRSWLKYGPSAFSYSVLEVVEDRSLLLQREQAWIDSERSIGKNGYNISPTAGSPLGVKHTQAARLNMRKSHLGAKLSEDHKAKIGAAGRGKKASEECLAKRAETRAKKTKEELLLVAEKIRKSSTGHKVSQETRAKISAALTGRAMSDEQKEILRTINLGKKMPPDAIARTAAAHRGVAKSAEHREKIRQTLTGRKQPAEHVENMAKSKRTPEAREKARIAQTGKKLSPESIAKRTATAKANRLAKKIAPTT